MVIDTSRNIPSFDGLVFHEENHTYWIGKNKLPSVTTVMKPLSSATYDGIDRAVIAKAAEKGTSVHQTIENYICFGIEDINPDYKAYFDEFLAFWSEIQPIPIATEMKLYHKFLMYAGTGDLLCEIGGKVVLIDYKTTAQLNPMLTRVQLEAYDKAIESHGLKVDGKAILHLRKDGTYRLEWHQTDDAEAWSVFGALLTVGQYISKFKVGGHYGKQS